MAEERKSVLSPELIGILSVGVPLAGLFLGATFWVTGFVDERFSYLDTRIQSLDARLDKVERNQAVLLERTAPLAPAQVDALPKKMK